MRIIPVAVLGGLALTGLAAIFSSNLALAAPAKPDWARKPTAEDFAAEYPKDHDSSGLAVIHCGLDARGYTKNCYVLTEAPANKGFGHAALKLARFFKANQSVEGAEVTIPIHFSLMGTSAEFVVEMNSAPWKSTPSAEDVIAAFPASAAGQVTSAIVDVGCYVVDSGGLDGCSAQPSVANLDFAKAALSLIKQFSVDPAWRANHVVKVNFKIQLASAEDSIWRSPHLGKVVWLKAPDAEMVRSLFPPDALKAKVPKGAAKVDCLVAPTGALTECKPLSETPIDLGFGEAGTKIAQQFAMNPWTATGLPAGGQHMALQLTMEYDKDPTTPTPATKP